MGASRLRVKVGDADRIMEDEMGRACGGGKRNVCRVLVEEIRPLARSRRKWEGVINMDFKKGMGGRGLDLSC